MGHFMHFDITVPPEGQANAAVQTGREERGMISGVVVDAAGLSVTGAAVQLYDGVESPASGPVFTCFTDEDGCFLFGPVTPGRHYRLRVFVERPPEDKLYSAPKRKGIEEPDSPQAYQAFKDAYRQ